VKSNPISSLFFKLNSTTSGLTSPLSLCYFFNVDDKLLIDNTRSTRTDAPCFLRHITRNTVRLACFKLGNDRHRFLYRVGQTELEGIALRESHGASCHLKKGDRDAEEKENGFRLSTLGFQERGLLV
jgi:hypothetical protein